MRVRRIGERVSSTHFGDDSSASNFIKKGTWTREEDALLLAFVDEHGAAAWNMASFYFPGLHRSGKSCRLRYVNQLRPGISRRSVSSDEERFILLAHAVFGNQWSKIASLIPGRTDNTVKNVVNMHLKKARRRAATLNFARAAAQMLCPFNLIAGMNALGLDGPCTGIPSSDSHSSLASADGEGEGISAKENEMLAAISSLYPADASATATCGESSMGFNNWLALQQAQLPSVQLFQGPSVGTELPSVQSVCNSLGGSATAHKRSSMQQQATYFECDMSDEVVSFGNSNMAATAGDKDLLEAVYNVSSGTSGISDRPGNVIDDSSLSAILIGCEAATVGSASVMACQQSNDGSGEAVLPASLFDDPGVVELLVRRGCDLGSAMMLCSPEWDTMPAASSVGDMPLNSFNCQAY
ncbi:hypothetical protein GOP47_0010185 [Adiantum capillus-veneris]|uniref:Uncharacterized protein n=1 Tax=Adiantum capillus-veneris TaxID=13818 RepID=A0A9D4UUA6_ADICA|nr:hypothetical protein GOP47_0010185 [Adiantum capillus-veneris]